jgi:type II secretory pathway component PulM
MPDNARSDRYEPLPGLTELPGYFLRKLSPRGRRAAAIIGVLLLVAVAVGLYFIIPAITDTKAERAAAERHALTRARGRRRDRRAQGTRRGSCGRRPQGRRRARAQR